MMQNKENYSSSSSSLRKEEIPSASGSSSSTKKESSSKDLTNGLDKSAGSTSNASMSTTTISQITPAISHAAVNIPTLQYGNLYLNYNVEQQVKKQEILIKKDYLKPNKVEKSRDDVSRVLNFNGKSESSMVNSTSSSTKSNKITNKCDSATKTNNNGNISHTKSSIENKELMRKDSTSTKKEPTVNDVKEEMKQEIKNEKTEIISNGIDKEKGEVKVKSEIKKGSENHSNSSQKESLHSRSEYRTSSSHHHSNSSSSHHKHHSSSSSHHKSSSSSHRSSHSSSRDCSKCYKRSKIKKSNIGVQCSRNEKVNGFDTPKKSDIKFEPSPRIGLANRDFNCTRNGLEHLKYGKFFRVEAHPNGGATVVHAYQDELNTLSEEELEELADEFFEFVFSEDENGFAHHVMGIVHDAASYLPDLLEHMAENYSQLTVKAGVLGRNSDIETLSMFQYSEQVCTFK